jgi:hypothetical protein
VLPQQKGLQGTEQVLDRDKKRFHAAECRVMLASNYAEAKNRWSSESRILLSIVMPSHDRGKRTLKGRMKFKITLEQAKKKGRRPCGICYK